jgi:hypothetical protein
VFVTLTPIVYYEGVRSDFLQYFDSIETYCVSIEGLSSVNKVKHLHAYLKFVNGVSFEYVRDCLSRFPGTANVQSVRSRRNVLRYITKEDERPYFNCGSGELSFYYRAHEWARSTPTFRVSDSFVMEHPQYYRLLREVFNEINDRSARSKHDVHLPRSWWPNWGMDVLLQVFDQCRCRSWKGLYLYGLPGIGKSFMVKACLDALGLSRVYMPVPCSFFFGEFRKDLFDCVLFEEWDFDLFKTILFIPLPINVYTITLNSM